MACDPSQTDNSDRSTKIIYPKLVNPSVGIRLLEILPGGADDVVEVKWRIVRLDKVPVYEALSYTWGNEGETEIIRLDKLEAHIRPNLHSALRRIRKSSEVRILWIDALCINQQDVAERNAQVARMHEIFAGAEQVLVWLGEAADDSDLAMGYNGLTSETSPGTTDTWAQGVVPYWLAFACLIKRSWWQRIWIVQEVVVAKKILVMCGSKSLPWRRLMDNLLLFIRIVQRLGIQQAPVRLPEEVQFFQRLERFPKIFKNQAAQNDLLGLLGFFRDYSATDPRDKVFGLLNVVVRDTFKADYSLNVKDVYLQAACHLIQNLSNLDLLGFAMPQGRLSGLPSWVPDWSQVRQGGPMWILDSEDYQSENPPVRSYIHFRASKLYSAGGSKPSVTFSADGTRLTTPVAVFGNVLFACPPHEPGMRTHLWRDLENLIVLPFEENGWSPYGSEREWRSAFRRTIVMDAVDQTRLDIDAFARFEAWFEKDQPKTKLTTRASDRQVDPTDTKTKLVQTSSEEALNMSAQFLSEQWLEMRLNDTAVKDAEFDEEDDKWGGRVNDCDIGRVLFVNDNHLLGLGPSTIRENDLVVIALGAATPWVIRHVKEELYEFLGQCYIHGLMDEDWFESTKAFVMFRDITLT